MAEEEKAISAEEFSKVFFRYIPHGITAFFSKEEDCNSYQRAVERTCQDCLDKGAQ